MKNIHVLTVSICVALLASGQSSTITGTLAGQIVMEGFLRIRIAPWLRRLITRGLAIVPALVVISATGGRDTVGLLVVSQVVLSMQLPFAIFPLMMVTSSRHTLAPSTLTASNTSTGISAMKERIIQIASGRFIDV